MEPTLWRSILSYFTHLSLPRIPPPADILREPPPNIPLPEVFLAKTSEYTSSWKCYRVVKYLLCISNNTGFSSLYHQVKSIFPTLGIMPPCLLCQDPPPYSMFPLFPASRFSRPAGIMGGFTVVDSNFHHGHSEQYWVALFWALHNLRRRMFFLSRFPI